MSTYHDDQDPNLPVGETHFTSLPVTDVTGGTLSGAKTIVGQSLSGEDLLLLGQPFGSSWPIGQEVPREETDKRRADTFDDEEPLPALQSFGTVKVLGDQTGEKTRESTRDGGGGVVD